MQWLNVFRTYRSMAMSQAGFLLLLEAYQFFFSSFFVFQMVHLITRHKYIAIYLGTGIQIFNARSGVLL